MVRMVRRWIWNVPALNGRRRLQGRRDRPPDKPWRFLCGVARRAKVSVVRKLAALLHRLWVTGEIYDPVGHHAKRGLEEMAMKWAFGYSSRQSRARRSVVRFASLGVSTLRWCEPGRLGRAAEAAGCGARASAGPNVAPQ